jgi:HD-like signal output (HDOD) protein
MSSQQLIELAGHDQTLAGALVQAANGAKYTWSGKVRTLEQAVAYLGEIRATQMLVEAALKPILAAVSHRRLWEHSLEAAAVAHRLATSSRMMAPSDAYLLGLVHDAGALLLALAPADARASLRSLTNAGCETPVAELLIFGTTHAQAGADVLRFWNMPEDYIDAVEHHHDPETGGGAGAALLYLTEQWTEPDGDRLRDDRLDYSLATLNLKEALPYKWDHALQR